MFKKVLRSKVFLVMTALLVGLGTLSAFYLTEGKGQARKHYKPTPKNIIFMVGDGMGVSYLAAHRYMKDNPETTNIELTTFDHHLVGMQTTYANDPKENITDSSSAATAMSAGIKTYNSAVAVDVNKKEVKTVLEEAKEIGKATGLVATSELTHATPASYGGHDEGRWNMDQLADDYYDELIHGKHKIDVMLGGGRKHFIRNDRNLVKEFQKSGFSYVTSKDELLKDKNGQILGIFADKGLPKMIDRSAEIPSLKEMATDAIKRLNKNKNGFFLMVEGSQIDWAGHDNDVVAAMSEMEDFEQAYKAVLDFAKKDKETLVVLTSDHSTGGFSMGANGEYNWFPEPIKQAKRTPDFMSAEIAGGRSVEEVLSAYSGLELSAEELLTVQEAAKPVSGKINTDQVDAAIEKLYDKRTMSGWTTKGHTGEDVAVFAYGPGKERFAGLIDNTDNAKIIFEFLKGNVPPPAPKVRPVTRNSDSIEGVSQPNTVVMAKVGGRLIGKDEAEEDGSFEIDIDEQKSGTKISVVATDEKGRSSEAAVITVK